MFFFFFFLPFSSSSEFTEMKGNHGNARIIHQLESHWALNNQRLWLLDLLDSLHYIIPFHRLTSWRAVPKRSRLRAPANHVF